MAEQDTAVAPARTTGGLGGDAGPAGRRRAPLDALLIGGVVLVLLTLLALVVLPLAGLAWNALSDGGSLSLTHVRDAVSAPGFGRVALNTALLGLGSVLVALCCALPLAWFYSRTDFRAKNLLLLVVITKVAVPGFLVALGYIFLCNPTNGILNSWWRSITGASGPLIDIYSIPWAAVLQGIDLVPPAFFLIVPIMRAIDGSLEQAGEVHGLTRLRTIRHVLAPILAPTIVAVAVFCFVLAIESFDYAGMLLMGARINVFATWIYQYTEGTTGLPDYGGAAAVGLLATVGIGVLMVGYYLALRRGRHLATVGGKQTSTPPLRLGRAGRAVGYGALGLFSIAGFLLPAAMLAWSSLLPYLVPPSGKALSLLTISGYRAVSGDLPTLFAHTAILVVGTATVVVLLGLVASWLTTRGRVRGRGALDGAIMAGLAVPSIVFGLVFLVVGLRANRVLPIYGTLVLVVLAVAARNIAMAHRTISGSMSQVSGELEEFCQSAGVSRTRALVFFLTPAVKDGLLFAWFWVALLTLRELSITILLAGPGNQVFSTRIYELFTSGQTNQASALGAVQFALVALLVPVFHRVARRQML